MLSVYYCSVCQTPSQDMVYIERVVYDKYTQAILFSVPILTKLTTDLIHASCIHTLDTHLGSKKLNCLASLQFCPW